jgi:hypothetical protein
MRFGSRELKRWLRSFSMLRFIISGAMPLGTTSTGSLAMPTVDHEVTELAGLFLFGSDQRDDETDSSNRRH